MRTLNIDDHDEDRLTVYPTNNPRRVWVEIRPYAHPGDENAVLLTLPQITQLRDYLNEILSETEAQ